MSLATAYVIYDGTGATYEGGLKTIQINCDRLRAYSPRPCYLKRRLMPGDGTQIQYLLVIQDINSSPTDPEIDSNTIQGFAIEVDGQDTMIDIVSADALVAACNCPNCNTPNANFITRFYTSGISAFTPPVANHFCVTRSDDGSGYAHDKMVMDYTGRYIGNIRMKSNTSGVSVYTFDSFYALARLTPVGSDVITIC